MLHDRFTLTHLNHVTATPKQLSVAQEDQLLAQINSYASRGTLLTHGQIKQLTEAVIAKDLSVDWTSCFIQRQSSLPTASYPAMKQTFRHGSVSVNSVSAYKALNEVGLTGVQAKYFFWLSGLETLF
jgi:hypothetical protein